MLPDSHCCVGVLSLVSEGIDNNNILLGFSLGWASANWGFKKIQDFSNIHYSYLKKKNMNNSIFWDVTLSH